MHEMTNETVLFNIGKAQKSAEEDFRSGTGYGRTGQRTVERPVEASPSDVNALRDDDADSTAWNYSSTDDAPPDDDYNTLLPLEIFESLPGVYKNLEISKAKVNVSPEEIQNALDDKRDGDLITALSYEKDGVHMIVKDRVCEQCLKTLPRQSGMMPTYVVLLIGTSNSGKTVYLTSLYHELSRVQLPLASIQMTSQGRVGERFRTMSETMFRHGTLPAGTTDFIEEPLAMHITVSVSGGNATTVNKRECLLCLADMRGEDWSRELDLSRRAKMFRHLDGYIMVLDPRTFRDYYKLANNEENENVASLSEFSANLRNEVFSLFDGGTISTPTAVVITKSDLFWGYRDRLPAVGLGLHIAGIARNMPEIKDCEYFMQLDRGAKTILQTLDPNVLDTVELGYTNLFCSTISSLGYDAEVNGKTVANPALIRPTRVFDPILWLLMKYNVLPPYDRTENSPRKIQENYRLINAWGTKYCANWQTLYPPQLQNAGRKQR